jgi:hypothetical protein
MWYLSAPLHRWCCLLSAHTVTSDPVRLNLSEPKLSVAVKSLCSTTRSCTPHSSSIGVLSWTRSTRISHTHSLHRCRYPARRRLAPPPHVRARRISRPSSVAMEYIRPLTPPSLLQRVHIFCLDVMFVCACMRRFIEDHLLTPHPPQPQPIALPKDHTPSYIAPTTKHPTKEQVDRKDDGPAIHTASSSASPSPSSPPYQLRVLSLNIWGLPISPRTDVRAVELSKSFHLFDLVALQECSHEREVLVLRERAREAGLRYAHQFTNGVGFPIWHGTTTHGHGHGHR